MCNARHLQSCKDHAIAGACTTVDTARNLTALAVLLTMFSRGSPSAVVQRQFIPVARIRYLVRHAVECCGSCKRVAVCIRHPAPLRVLPVHDIDYAPCVCQNLHGLYQYIWHCQLRRPYVTPLSTVPASAPTLGTVPGVCHMLIRCTAQIAALLNHRPALESQWLPPGAVRGGRPACRPAAAAT